MSVTTKNNTTGDFYKVDLEKTTVLNIFTKAGNYRGGKSYSVEKILTVISGKVELRQNIGGEDVITTHQAGELVTIPAGIPSILYFPEDTEMLEWFQKESKTEKFQKFYELKT